MKVRNGYLIRTSFLWLFLYETVISVASQQNQRSAIAPCQDSDQPWQPPRLIRIFAVRLQDRQCLSYLYADSEGPDQMGERTRYSECSQGAHANLFLSWYGSLVYLFLFAEKHRKSD